MVTAPMIEICENSRLDSRSVADILCGSDIIIFLSVNAVEYGLMPFPQRIKLIRGKKIFAIGQTTALKLMKLELDPVFYPKNSASTEGLLLLEGMSCKSLESKKVVVFKGVGGRRKLNYIMGKRGAIVSNILCYRRVASKLSLRSIFRESNIELPDLTISTSAAIVKNLAEKIKAEELDDLYNVPMIVISRRVKRIALSLGFMNELILADGATDRAILDATKNWIRRG